MGYVLREELPITGLFPSLVTPEERRSTEEGGHAIEDGSKVSSCIHAVCLRCRLRCGIGSFRIGWVRFHKVEIEVPGD